VLATLTASREAALRFDDSPSPIEEVAARTRRAIEAQTFAPSHGAGNVVLLDSAAARFLPVRDLYVVGLVAGEWPEPADRDIFYPRFLLSQLGWPSESARSAAARAAFEDLLHLPSRYVALSTFLLENDAIVEGSPFLEDLPPLQTREETDFPAGDDREDAPSGTTGSSERRAWLELRRSRSPSSLAAFHGMAAAAPSRSYSISAIDTYLECPFKYFSRYVLHLREEPTEAGTRTPRVRGLFVHEVFRAFFAAWQGRGGGTITARSLDSARALFTEVAGRQLSTLPAGDAQAERLRLLGSAASPGLGETVLAAEAARPLPVVERLLEYPFDGVFVLSDGDRTRSVRLRGKADRIDLLASRAIRVIDYKTGRAPDTRLSIQLPAYALCARQRLEADRGGRWEVDEALYIAFGERNPVRAAFDEGDKAAVLSEAQSRVLAAVEGIERGAFTPTPAETRSCNVCAFQDVCRKDHSVGE
jgi:ATP-dependent helicase/nuclease subunit B